MQRTTLIFLSSDLIPLVQSARSRYFGVWLGLVFLISNKIESNLIIFDFFDLNQISPAHEILLLLFLLILEDLN